MKGFLKIISISNQPFFQSIYEEFLSGKADKTKSFATECYARASDAVLNPLVEAIIPIMGSLSVDLKLVSFIGCVFFFC